MSQEENKKRKWCCTWQGKKVIAVESFGKILKSMEKYSKVVDVAIQGSPQVSSLVWAGIRAIMQVALNHVEAIEGCEAAIAVLLEKVYVCELYARVYTGVPLASQSTSGRHLQSMIDSALPEFYAAVIFFAVKARVYFEARGMKKLAITLKSFDVELQPLIEEIGAREGVIRGYADAATMETSKNIEGVLGDFIDESKSFFEDIKSGANKSADITSKMLELLTQLELSKQHWDVKCPPNAPAFGDGHFQLLLLLFLFFFTGPEFSGVKFKLVWRTVKLACGLEH